MERGEKEMKLLILLTLIASVMAICLKPVYADTWSSSIHESSALKSDDEYSVGAWHGIQFSYAPNDKGYFFISQEKMEIVTTGHAFDFYLTGLGVGNSVKISENFSIFGQVGYYIVKNSIGSRRDDSISNESLSYYLWKRYSFLGVPYPGRFDGFSLGSKDTIAGTIGVNMHYPVTKSLSLDLNTSFRLLKITQNINGYRHEWDGPGCPGCKFVAEGHIDYSSINYGFGLTYVF